MDKTSEERVEAATRPIIGIANRSAQEVYDIMCDRIRMLSAAAAVKAEPVLHVNQSDLDRIPLDGTHYILCRRIPEVGIYGTPLYAAPPTSELEALRKELNSVKISASAWEDSARINLARAETAEARLAETMKALEPFAAYIKARDEFDSDVPDMAGAVSFTRELRGAAVTVTMGDYRAARRVREGGKADG